MVIPAVLANTEKDFHALMETSKEFPYFQLDIMDGNLVPSTSITKDTVKNFDFSQWKIEAHLMVANPFEWLSLFKNESFTKIIFHIEIIQSMNKEEIHRLIKEIKNQNKQVGIAINPPTPLHQLDEFIPQTDSILFMCVNPGFYGAPFVEEVLEKINQFKNKYPTMHTSVDGGVKQSNFEKIFSTGVDSICIGSAIFNAQNPKKSFQDFTNQFESLKNVSKK